MTSHLDDRIREMMQRVVDESPPPLDLPIGPPPMPDSERTAPNWAIAVGAAVAVFILIGGVVWLVGGSGIEVIDEPEVTTTAGTTQPPATAQEVAGQWTTYSTEQGLPAGGMTGVAISPDGTAWASRLSSTGTLYRFDGAQWLPVDGTRYIPSRWMVATPDGGIAGWASTDGTIVRFDGSQWISTDIAVDVSAVVTGTIDPRVLGYHDGDLIDIRFTDASVVVRTASRGVNSGSLPSDISVSLTVDTDSHGNAWYGTIEGAWRFDGDTAELIELGERGDCCAPLAIDTRDNVWIHIDTGTLFRITPGGAITRFTARNGIPFLDGVLAIVPTSDGAVWLLEHGGGAPGRVAHFNDSVWTSYDVGEVHEAGLPTMPSGSGFALAQGLDGSTWTVRLRGGSDPVVHRFFNGRWKTVPITGIAWSDVGHNHGTLGMAVAPDGSLWIPTSTGVARFEPNRE